MNPESIPWFNHIELVGAFFVGIFILGTFIAAVIITLVQRWLAKPPCASCIAVVEVPKIKDKQEKHREEDHPALMREFLEMKGDIKLILRALKIEEGGED